MREILKLTGFRIETSDDQSTAWLVLPIPYIRPFDGAQVVYDPDDGTLYLNILVSKSINEWSEVNLAENLFDPLVFLTILYDLNVLNYKGKVKLAELLEEMNEQNN